MMENSSAEPMRAQRSVLASKAYCKRRLKFIVRDKASAYLGCQHMVFPRLQGLRLILKSPMCRVDC